MMHFKFTVTRKILKNFSDEYYFTRFWRTYLINWLIVSFASFCLYILAYAGNSSDLVWIKPLTLIIPLMLGLTFFQVLMRSGPKALRLEYERALDYPLEVEIDIRKADADISCSQFNLTSAQLRPNTYLKTRNFVSIAASSVLVIIPRDQLSAERMAALDAIVDALRADANAAG